ncbi:MAG: FixH family protein [Deltaproteobacteria bacterium]|nr:FixH family protein [Deltaproteobacteria bacterium]
MKKQMKRVALMVLLMVLVAGLVQAKDYEVQKKAGEYGVTVKMDKNPPVVGDNNVAITVKDAANADVKDARVVVEYSMPAMPGMPAMNYKADAKLSGSEYRAKINFSMTGAWNVVIKITRGGKTASAKMNVDVR